METLVNYSTTCQTVLTGYKNFVEKAGLHDVELITDNQKGHHLLLLNAWDGEKRSYGILLHLDVKDGKIWIQRDGTEDGIVDDLLEAGVPKEHIVLAYRSPFVRQFTEFAVS